MTHVKNSYMPRKLACLTWRDGPESLKSKSQAEAGVTVWPPETYAIIILESEIKPTF